MSVFQLRRSGIFVESECPVSLLSPIYGRYIPMRGHAVPMGLKGDGADICYKHAVPTELLRNFSIY
ncbi:hypothetical protein QUF90_07460 [Desulfococcaceae bacterium HSG9]|nr:hypothetical protein [Desulfococcaceae bacterium HSG9]